MANVTRKDGRLQDDKGNWVWGGEPYEEVLKHPDWLPLVFQNNESAEKFKKLEKIWKAEQIVKTSKNKQEVAAAKGWLKNNIRHSDGNFVYIPQNDFDFLMHHGIKGQKWGVENGPPYPLDDSVSTGKRLRIEKKSNKVKQEQQTRYQTALNLLGRSTELGKEWKNGNRTKEALDNAMIGIDTVKYAIEKYKDGVKKYPKKAEDFNEYIEEVRKNTDFLVTQLHNAQTYSNIDTKTEKAYNTYIDKINNGNKIANAASAVADTIGLIGGLHLAGPIGAIVGGTGAGITTHAIVSSSLEKKATKELQAYLDEMNK